MSGDRPLRVLIVEDEVLLATELEYLVAASGAEPVGHAMSSPEAVDLAEQLHPDLALVDVNLGEGESGVDAARTMIDRWGALVLFLTANLMRIPRDFAGACGAMSKPYSEHQLRSAIRFLQECLGEGRACRRPPPGLMLSPVYAERWGLPQAA